MVRTRRRHMLVLDMFREIKKTSSRFLSLTLLVMIAVSFLFGLRMAAPDMEESMDQYLDAQQVMDMHVLSTFGLTEDDVAAVLEVPGTAAAEGAFSVDALASPEGGGDTVTVKAISIGETGINQPYLVEGEWPKEADECLVEEAFLAEEGVGIGDEITLAPAEVGQLNGKTFRVTGTAKSPLYTSLARGTSSIGSGTVGAIVMLRDEAFGLDYYTDLYICVEGAKAYNAYSDEYKDLLDDYKEKLEGIRAEREEARTKEVQNELPKGLSKFLAMASGVKLIGEDEEAKWYIFTRFNNTGISSFEQDADRMDRLALLFPTVFYLVAALVCLTTMTRMVQEQRMEIGSLKALGYSRVSIAMKYVGYGFFAALIGSALGLSSGVSLIPWIIVHSWKVMYDFPGIRMLFGVPTAIGCVAAAMFSCGVGVFAAALGTLRTSPAGLMRPKAPAKGTRILLERITPIWKRLSFTRKVSARNLFRYKKRLGMTVIGIAGCTALIVTGFGLHDSIMDVVDLQFKDVSTYSALLFLDGDITPARKQEVVNALEKEEILDAYAYCLQDTVTFENGDHAMDGFMLCMEDAGEYAKFWDFHDRKTKEAVPLSDDGVLISEKTAKLLDVEAGDPLTLVRGDDRYEVKVAGVIEHYVQHYIFMTKAYYADVFGEEMPKEQFYLLYDENDDWESMGERLLELPGVAGIYYSSESINMIRHQLNGVYPAVIIIISAAAALAFVVLYNLNSINITERLRELATLKVLGFYEREVREYVFRENVVLTLLGIALGLPLGKAFHAYLITTVEVSLVMFGRDVSVLSCILSVAMTALFAVLVNFASEKRLRSIDMVESLKSVE